MKGLTFSGMERAEICSASPVLPHSRRETKDAQAGTAKHSFHENVGTIGRERALALVPAEHRKACEQIDLDALPASHPDRWSFEVAFAYNVDTGEARELGRGLNRKYHSVAHPPSEREVCGTLDVVGVTEDAVVYPDLKSGFGADVAPARENWQLRIGALAAARAYGKHRAHVAIIHLRDGEPYWERAELSELDLDATEHAIRRVVARVERARETYESGKTPDTTLGEHCKFCPALTSCPGQMGLVAAALGKQLGPEVLNEETAPLLLARLEAIEFATKAMWATLEDYASVRPIDLGDGWFYGKTQKPRTSIDAELAPKVLADVLGLNVEPEVKRVLTQAALKEAIRANLQPGQKQTKVFEAAMEVLRQAGAVEVVHVSSIAKFKAKALPTTTTMKSPEENAEHAAQAE